MINNNHCNMRVVCAALNCKYSSENEDSSSIIFINFPDDDTAKVWAKNCERSDLAAMSNAELHLNYYVCSHHIEDRFYISKTVPIIIEQGAVPTLFGTDLNVDNESPTKIFDKSQNFQEVSNNVPLTFCDMNVEIDEYHDITIRFSNLCRICGESVADGIDIFAAKGIELRLKEKISLHMPVSIDINDSMPQKVCIECCNKLEITHLLAISCLRTDIRLKKFFNIEREPEYENKYNALVEKCSLEIAQEMCSTHLESVSLTTGKKISPNLETGLGNNEHSETQNNSFKNAVKTVVSTSEINITNQTYEEVNSRNNKTVVRSTSQNEENKIQNEKCNILCLHCQTYCETREMYENHKILCIKKKSISKYTTTASILKEKTFKNKVVNIELNVESSQTTGNKFESERLNDKTEDCEPMQSTCCNICNQLFETQQDFDSHKHIHANLENTSMGSPSKRCGHCKEIYTNKKDLLNHISQSHKGQLLLQCFTCDKTYAKWSSLDIHEATHRMDKPYLCDLCGKSFKHSNNLRGHRRTHLDECIKKRHVCEVCGSAFRSRFHLQEHKNQHDDKRPYSCDQCGKAFYKRVQLRQHKLSHGSNKYTCPICGVTFNRRGNMNTHMKRHSNENGTCTCSVCAYKCKSMSELKIHRKKHTEEEILDSIMRKSADKEVWRCNVCSKVFPKRTTLVNHERNHNNDKPHVECDECGKKLANKSSLLYHKKSIHLRERSHMCHYCGESFVSREARLVHERIHTGERPYVCKVCNMRYRCSSNLSQHMKIHTGLKPHKCRYCNKDFARKGALTVHERIHTGVKPYPCEICGRCFSQKNDMLKHIKTHNGKLMQCDRCNEVFKRKKDMLKHTAVHKQDTSVIPGYVSTSAHIFQPDATGSKTAQVSLIIESFTEISPYAERSM